MCIFEAIATNNMIELRKIILSEDVSLSEVDKTYKATPLHYAVVYERLDMVNELLKSGADVNVKDKESRTPLFIAVQKNNYDIVLELLNSKADPKIADMYGDTCMHLAAGNGNVEIAKLLMSYGADIKPLTNDGASVLHSAAIGLVNGYSDWTIIEWLLENGSDKSVIDAEGKSVEDILSEVDWSYVEYYKELSGSGN